MRFWRSAMKRRARPVKLARERGRITKVMEQAHKNVPFSSEEGSELPNTMLAGELGFGMWRDRADLEDVSGYV